MTSPRHVIPPYPPAYLPLPPRVTGAPVPPPRPDRVLVEPGGDSRLEALLTLQPHLRAEHEAAKAKWEEVVKAICEELDRMPVQPAVAFDVAAHPRGLYPAATRTWVPTRRLDSRRLKADDPVTWEQYATDGGHWMFRAA